MEIPASLRAWFVVHFLIDVGIAIPLLLAPEAILPSLGWTVIDSVTPRLVAAALMSIGIQSWRCRNATVEGYRVMLGLKIVWSTSAILGLTIAIARGAPPLTFAVLSVFVGFCGVWSHYAIRLRQQARAAEAPRSPSDDDDDSATHAHDHQEAQGTAALGGEPDSDEPGRRP